MKNPSELKYSKSHEWVRAENGIVTVGITHHAQDALGDIVFVELPAVGKSLEANQPFGVVESIKAVSDLYLPFSGKITEVNSVLVDEPGTVNSDPYGKGWMIKVTPAKPQELDTLLSVDQYDNLVESSH